MSTAVDNIHQQFEKVIYEKTGQSFNAKLI